jgi:hypothetical protein
VVEIKWVTVFLDVPAERQTETEQLWCQRAKATLSARRGPSGEYATFLPPDGDPYLRIQRVRDGAGGVHIDLHTDDLDILLNRALQLGAEPTRTDIPRLCLRSPAGAPFCIVAWHGEQILPSQRPIRQVDLHAPGHLVELESQFWAALVHPDAPPDCRLLESPAWPVKITLNESSAEGPAQWRLPGADDPSTIEKKDKK